MRLARILFSLVVLSGCASEADDAAPSASALDGVYQGDANWSWAWGGFHDGRYSLWKNGVACADPNASAGACLETGAFALDEGAKTLTLTDDATGRATALHIDIAVSSPSSSLTHPQAFVGSGSLVNGSGSLVATQFAVYQPSGDDLVQQVNLRSATFGLLQLCAILLGDPADKKIEVQLPPAPIVQTCDTGGGKKK